MGFITLLDFSSFQNNVGTNNLLRHYIVLLTNKGTADGPCCLNHQFVSVWFSMILQCIITLYGAFLRAKYSSAYDK